MYPQNKPNKPHKMNMNKLKKSIYKSNKYDKRIIVSFYVCVCINIVFQAFRQKKKLLKKKKNNNPEGNQTVVMHSFLSHNKAWKCLWFSSLCH